MVARLRSWHRERQAMEGYTLVEFAIASIIFLTLTLGGIDLGRAVYLNHQLHSAVRDAAREAKVGTANGYGFSNGTIHHRVLVAKNLIDGDEFTRLGLGPTSSSFTCTGACTTGDSLTVNGSLPFSLVLQDFLGIPTLTLSASATVTLE